MAEDDDTVGYGRPPKATQFKKGQSGNPKGRPKKAARAQLEPVMSKILRRPVTVTTPNGRRTTMPVAEAVGLSLVEQASRGKIGALKMVMSAQAQIEEKALREEFFADNYRIFLRTLGDASDLLEIFMALGLIYFVEEDEGRIAFKRDVFERLVAESDLEMHQIPRGGFHLSTPEIEAKGPTYIPEENLYDWYRRLRDKDMEYLKGSKQ